MNQFSADNSNAFVENDVSASSDNSHTDKFDGFVAQSSVMTGLVQIAKKVASTNSSVLLTGEYGVGKALFAKQIVLNSNRSTKPFVWVNCALFNDENNVSLIDAELFGLEDFEDENLSCKGRFDEANGGTIFLEEVSNLPLGTQDKILRVIQEKCFSRLGVSKLVNVDVRIIASTSKDLEEMVRQGKFREDLYFRLNVLSIRIPPLREHPEDIVPLALDFLKKYSADTGKTYTGFSKQAIADMLSYRWYGNVFELEKVIARACVLGLAPVIKSADLRLKEAGTLSTDEEDGDAAGIDEESEVIASDLEGDRTLKTALEKFKRAYVIKILEECSWNQTKASKILGIQRTYVSRLKLELNIREDK